VDRPILETIRKVRTGQFLFGSLVFLFLGLLLVMLQQHRQYTRSEQAAETRYRAMIALVAEIRKLELDLRREFDVATDERRDILATLRVCGDRLSITAKEIREQRRAIDTEARDGP